MACVIRHPLGQIDLVSKINSLLLKKKRKIKITLEKFGILVSNSVFGNRKSKTCLQISL